MERIFEVKSPGSKITIKLDNVGLEIHRTGFGTFGGFKGAKKLFYKNISSVHLKNSTTFSQGFLQLTFQGSQEKTSFSGFSLAFDENTIMFSKKDSAMMQELKMLIERKIVEASVPATSQATIITEKSIVEQIKEFKELFDLGIISEDEFNLKKKQLLNL